MTTYPGGTVSVNLGSTLVTGVGTSFTTAFTCNSQDYIGFNTTRSVYLVTSCADNTHLTISPVFGNQGEVGNISGSTIDEAPQNLTGPGANACGTSLATFCEWGGAGIAAPDRNLTRLMPGMTAWLYNQTGDSQYLIWADEWFSAAFGGPASGLGSDTRINGPLVAPSQCAGPACDGYVIDWIGSLRDCASNAPPCVSGGNPFNLAKNYAEGPGVPGSDNELAWRLGPIAGPTTRMLPIGFDLASVPAATHVTMTVTQPNGVSTTTTCLTSPCTVTADARQGDHLVLIHYRGANNTVLKAGRAIPIVVQ
jgi:hypothetical protein